MGRLFDLVLAHRAKHEPYPPSLSKIAEQVGVSRQTLINWQTPTKLIDKPHLIALAETVGVSYETVRDALMDDIGYLYEHQEQVAARTSKRTPKGRAARARQDGDGEAPDPPAPDGGS